MNYGLGISASYAQSRELLFSLNNGVEKIKRKPVVNWEAELTMKCLYKKLSSHKLILT
jgi:hypothetical protein